MNKIISIDRHPDPNHPIVPFPKISRLAKMSIKNNNLSSMSNSWSGKDSISRQSKLGSSINYTPPTNKYCNNQSIEEVLVLLKDLCEHPVLYINFRIIKEPEINPSAPVCASPEIVLTISNNKPEINQEENEVKYPSDSIALDLFQCYYSDSMILSLGKHLAKIICSILTFRGHEVFLDNKLFIPSENFE